MTMLEDKIKRICSFYVSDYHLVTMLLPYIKEKLQMKNKIITILEKSLEQNMEKLIENINFKNNEKQEILNIGWTKSTKIDIEKILDKIQKDKKEIIILINGKNEYIKQINKKINLWINKNQNKIINIIIINCYEVTQFNENIKEILDAHDKILNTSGEKEIIDVFGGYNDTQQNIVNK